MATPNNAEDVRRVARTAQILLAVAAALPLLLLAMVLIIEPPGPPRAPEPGGLLGLPFLTLTAVVSGAVGLVLSFLAPALIVANVLKRRAETPAEHLAPMDPWEEGLNLPASDDEALLQLFQTQLLIASGLTEGTAFFPLLVYAFEPHPLTLGSGALLIAVLLSRFPTLDRVHGWLDDQSARLARIRRGDF